MNVIFYEYFSVGDRVNVKYCHVAYPEEIKQGIVCDIALIDNRELVKGGTLVEMYKVKYEEVGIKPEWRCPWELERI